MNGKASREKVCTRGGSILGDPNAPPKIERSFKLQERQVTWTLKDGYKESTLIHSVCPTGWVSTEHDRLGYTVMTIGPSTIKDAILTISKEKNGSGLKDVRLEVSERGVAVLFVKDIELVRDML